MAVCWKDSVGDGDAGGDDSLQGVVSGFYIRIKFNFSQGAPSSLCLPK